MGERVCQVRFLFPVLPLFNTGAAVAVARIASSRHRSAAARVAHLGCCCVLAAGFLVTLLMTAASRNNYPGGMVMPPALCTTSKPCQQAECPGAEAERRKFAGVALQRLHDLAAPEAARALAAGQNLSVPHRHPASHDWGDSLLRTWPPLGVQQGGARPRHSASCMQVCPGGACT